MYLMLREIQIFVKFFMILQQNYTKIAENTQRAFRIYCKRLLGDAIVSLLGKRTTKSREKIMEESDDNRMTLSLNKSTFSDKKLLGLATEGLEEKDAESVHSDIRRPLNTDKTECIGYKCPKQELLTLKYGDLIYLEYCEIGTKTNYRVSCIVNSIKLSKLSEQGEEIKENSRSIFEICHPFEEEGENPEFIDSYSLVCLKNVTKNLYLSCHRKVSLMSDFGFRIQLSEEVNRSSVFNIINKGAEEDPIISDQDYVIKLFVEEYYLKIHEQNQQLGLSFAFQASNIKITKSKDKLEDVLSPYIYIKHIKTDQYLKTNQLLMQSIISKKSYNCFLAQTDNETFNLKTSADIFHVDLKKKFDQQIKIETQDIDNILYYWKLLKLTNKNNYTVWKVYHPIVGLGVSIKNIKNQVRLVQNVKEMIEMFIEEKDQKGLGFKFSDKDIQVNYNHKTEKYSLNLVASDHNLSQDQSESRTFELVPVGRKKSELVMALLQIFQTLEKNYCFLENWGFVISEKNQQIIYSIKEIKNKSNQLTKNLREIKYCLNKLKAELQNPLHELSEIQKLIKQIKILQLLIYLGKLIVLKIDKKDIKIEGIDEPFQYAKVHLEPYLNSIFSIFLLLIKDNKESSSIIISHSKFFNHVLITYPQKVGEILQQAIKNLSIFTTKTLSSQCNELFQWVNLIEPVSEKTVKIQKTYIDIIAEVVVDPQDKGILPYQNKCKELLFLQRSQKRKSIPRFSVSGNEPIIIFDNEANMNLFFQKNPLLKSIRIPSSNNVSFQIQSFFLKIEDESKTVYDQYVQYIGSIIMLFRNLCKDRNKKLIKIVEDWGLSQNHIYLILNCNIACWQLRISYLNLWISIFLDQDPFLPFSKRETKCHIWRKIGNYDFSESTAIFFKQFTDEVIAKEKLNQFSVKILPFLKKFFDSFQNKIETQKYNDISLNCFEMVLQSISQMMNFGYLTLQLMKNSIGASLILIKKLINEENFKKSGKNRKEKLENLIKKMTNILIMYEQFWIQVYGMKLIKDYYLTFSSKSFTKDQKDIQSSWENIILNKFEEPSKNPVQNHRKKTNNYETNSFRIQGKNMYFGSGVQYSYQSLNNLIDNFIIQILCCKIINEKSKAYQKIIELAELKTQRIQKISSYLTSIIILNNSTQEKIYSDFNGRQSGKLLNWLKIQQLVSKIKNWEFNGVSEGEQEKRKKQKILQLNNILVKIIRELKNYKKGNIKTLKKCQQILEKLHIHSMLLDILEYNDKKGYVDLIKTVYEFFLEFIDQNENNLLIISCYIQKFISSFKYPMFPSLFPKLFKKVANDKKIIIFEQMCKWIYKTIDPESSKLLLETIHSLISDKNQVQNSMKEKLFYSLTNYTKIDTILNQKLSFQLINIFCQISVEYPQIREKIKKMFPKAEIIKYLTNEDDYVKKKIYLKILLEFYINRNILENFEIEAYLMGFIRTEIKKLPTICAKLIEKLSKEEYRQINRIYEQLETDKTQKVSFTNQEDYFTYILDSKNSKEISLLVFMENIVKMWNQDSQELFQRQNTELLTFLGKVWEFLYFIFIKNSTIYQRSILWKIEEISTLFRKKRKKFIERDFVKNVSEQQKKRVKQFFHLLAEFLFKERISFQKLLQCFNLDIFGLNQRRSGYNHEYFISQSEFDECLNRLASKTKKKSQLFERIEGTKICKIFNYFKDRKERKINLYSFMEKLISTLERIKQIKIQNALKVEQENVENVENQNNFEVLFDYEESEQIREKQLFIQLNQFCKTKLSTNLVKKQMKTQIQNTLTRMKEEDVIQTWAKGQNTRIVKVHKSYPDCSVLDWLSYQIIKKIGDSWKKISDEIIHTEYLTFLKDKFKLNLKQETLNSIQILIKEHQMSKQIEGQLLDIFEILFISSKSSTSQSNSLVKLFKIYEECIMILSSKLSSSFYQQLQLRIAETFIFWSESLSQINAHSYDLHKQLIEMSINILVNSNILIKKLSQSHCFKRWLFKLFETRTQEQILSSNQEARVQSYFCSIFIKLFIKFNFKKYHEYLSILLNQFEWAKNFQITQRLYLSFILRKIKDYEEDRICRDFQQCSSLHCNHSLFSPGDDFMIDYLIKVLILLQLILSFNNQLSSHCIDSQFMFGKIVGSITLKVNADMRTNYFFRIPYLRRYFCYQIQEEMNNEILNMEKQSLYKNIYNLSIFFQEQLMTHFSYQKNFLLKFLLLFRRPIKKISYLILATLIILLVNEIYVTELVITVMSILFAFNLVYFARDMQTYIHHVNYSKNIALNAEKMDNEKSSQSFIVIALLSFFTRPILFKIAMVVFYFICIFNHDFLGLVLILELLVNQSLKSFTHIFAKAWIKSLGFMLSMLLILFISLVMIFQEPPYVDYTFPQFFAQFFFEFYISFLKGTRLTSPENIIILKNYPLLLLLFQVLLSLFIIKFIARVAFEIKKISHKNQKMNNQCLICLKTKKQLESEGINFEKHKKDQHSIWSYLYFFINLRKKQSNLEGIESYVQDCVKRKDFTFLKSTV